MYLCPHSLCFWFHIEINGEGGWSPFDQKLIDGSRPIYIQVIPGVNPKLYALHPGGEFLSIFCGDTLHLIDIAEEFIKSYGYMVIWGEHGAGDAKSLENYSDYSL